MDITIDPLEKIKEISINCESVREYIDTQSYLMDTDCVDALDEVGILTQCYLILIDELKRKGILFISIDAIFTNDALHMSTRKSTSSFEYGVEEKSIPISSQYFDKASNFSGDKEKPLTILLAMGLES